MVRENGIYDIRFTQSTHTVPILYATDIHSNYYYIVCN